ncbi:MAG: hypothetical protein LBV74_18575 [Tannerella sp.]|jgi:Spy/CpxP family protein refolding chaperone|nr:hypothetical protein [Tannerella sp.]
MKKINFIVCISALLLISLQSVAQKKDHGDSRDGRKPFDREEFISKRNIYITEKVGLTAEETAVFIPLDNELMWKKFEIGRKCHRLERELRNKNDKSEEEYNKLLKCREEVKEKRDRLDKEYLEKFKKVLSAEQILKYQNADKEFFDEYMRDRKK